MQSELIIRELCEEKLTDDLEPSKLSKIIVADDQDINLAILREFFGSLNVQDVTYCINGQTAIDTCKAIMDDAVKSATEGSSLQPLSLVILDY